MPSKVIETWPERVQLEALAGHPSASVGATAKSGFIIKQGDVVGEIASGGKFRRRSRTNAAGGGFDSASDTGEVDDASVFKAADVLKDEDGQTIGTVLSIDTEADPNTVKLTGNAAHDVASGKGVLAQDGSAVSQGVSDNETDGTEDTAIAVIVSGKLKGSLLRGLDASAKAELAGASLAGGVFKF
jgi:hypothetical protein